MILTGRADQFTLPRLQGAVPLALFRLGMLDDLHGIPKNHAFRQCRAEDPPQGGHKLPHIRRRITGQTVANRLQISRCNPLHQLDLDSGCGVLHHADIFPALFLTARCSVHLNPCQGIFAEGHVLHIVIQAGLFIVNPGFALPFGFSLGFAVKLLGAVIDLIAAVGTFGNLVLGHIHSS